MSKNTVGKEKELATKIHRVTHASRNKFYNLLCDAGIRNIQLEASHDRFVGNCNICVSSGRPQNKQKISLSHVNKAFIEEIQVDFLVVYIRHEKFVILNIVDIGTSYGEREIVPDRSAPITQTAIEKI